MRQITFLLEEPSMKEFIENFIPRVFPDLDFLCIKHEGKQDLEKSIPRKLAAWGAPRPLFVIVRDNDQANCLIVKKKLAALCKKEGHQNTLIRIACQELESWYLGSIETVATVYSRQDLLPFGRRKKYRDPDTLASPSNELYRLVPEFRKIDGARRMGSTMPTDEERNTSQSFRVFVKGIRRLVAL